MMIAGDANVWHPHFRMRTRTRDSLVFPFVDLLISSCNLENWNPREQATHVAGGGLDCVFISGSCAVPVSVHSGDHCCGEAPVVLSSSRIRSFLVHCTFDCPPPPPRGPFGEGPSGGLFLFSGAWELTLLLCAHHVLVQWSARLDALLCGPLPREANRSPIVDDIFNSLLTILRHHAPSQRQHPRRRQPAWWTAWWSSECFEACVARNGAWRGFRRTQEPRDRIWFLRRTDPCPPYCEELPKFILVPVARPCCQSFPRESTRRRQCSSPHFPLGPVPTRPDTLCPLASRAGSS